MIWLLLLLLPLSQKAGAFNAVDWFVIRLLLLLHLSQKVAAFDAVDWFASVEEQVEGVLELYAPPQARQLRQLRQLQTLGTPVYYANYNPMDLHQNTPALDGQPQLTCSNPNCPTGLTNFMRCALNGNYDSVTHLPKFNCALSPALPLGYSLAAASLVCNAVLSSPSTMFYMGSCHAMYTLSTPPTSPTKSPTPPTLAPSRHPTTPTVPPPPTLSPSQIAVSAVVPIVVVVLAVLFSCFCFSRCCSNPDTQPTSYSSSPPPLAQPVYYQQPPPERIVMVEREKPRSHNHHNRDAMFAGAAGVAVGGGLAYTFSNTVSTGGGGGFSNTVSTGGGDWSNSVATV